MVGRTKVLPLGNGSFSVMSSRWMKRLRTSPFCCTPIPVKRPNWCRQNTRSAYRQAGQRSVTQPHWKARRKFAAPPSNDCQLRVKANPPRAFGLQAATSIINTSLSPVASNTMAVLSCTVTPSPLTASMPPIRMLPSETNI